MSAAEIVAQLDDREEGTDASVDRRLREPLAPRQRMSLEARSYPPPKYTPGHPMYVATDDFS